MADPGHGNDWSPINGKAPWWVNFCVWVLRQGFLFQIATVVFLGVLIGVLIGRIDSPMLTAFQTIAEKTEQTVGSMNKLIHEMEEQTKRLNRLIEVSLDQRNISVGIKQNTEPLEQLKDMNKR